MIRWNTWNRWNTRVSVDSPGGLRRLNHGNRTTRACGRVGGFFLRALVLIAPLTAAAAVPAAAGPQEMTHTLADPQRSVHDDLQASIHELAALRARIAAEKVPLGRQLGDLEGVLRQRRARLQEESRTLDARNLELGTLETAIKARRDGRVYLSSLLDEYIRNLETRLHVTELQRYHGELDAARGAVELSHRDPDAAFQAQTAIVEASLDRLLDLIGGTTFEGRAVGDDGRLSDVRFALMGPVVLYRTADGDAGLAEQRLGSLEPNMIGFDNPSLAAAASDLVANGKGELPFDATLGGAHAIAQVEDTLTEHVQKGGVVMIPILLLAAAALLVSAIKWVQLARIPPPSTRSLAKLFTAVQQGDYAGASRQAVGLAGPSGSMLQAGLAHILESKSLVEEVMFEKTLEARLRLQSLLPFIAVAAAAAPLLGLLGTVTGMINTFQLITVFGTGDPKTLSSGISEALITTEFGLIVAIPSLLLHAYLSRKARRILNSMETIAVTLLNRISVVGVPLGPAPGHGAGTVTGPVPQLAGAAQRAVDH